jgi:GTP-binding protein YchF
MHYTLHTTHYTLHTTHYALHTTHYTLQVVRCFIDDDIIHVDGNVDPVRDIEVIELELILADQGQIEKRMERALKDKKADPVELAALTKVNDALLAGLAARTVVLNEEELLSIKSLMLLTIKPIIYAANVADADLSAGNSMSQSVFDYAKSVNAECVLVSAQVESELVQMEEADRAEFLADLGVNDDDCGLKALTRKAYDTLGLQTYFTSGPTETRAWTIRKGMTAPQAAGVIHTDFEKGFIRAETMSYDDLKAAGSEKVVKEKGQLRSEGKEYVMAEGDVVLFRFNV